MNPDAVYFSPKKHRQYWINQCNNTKVNLYGLEYWEEQDNYNKLKYEFIDIKTTKNYDSAIVNTHISLDI